MNTTPHPTPHPTPVRKLQLEISWLIYVPKEAPLTSHTSSFRIHHPATQRSMPILTHTGRCIISQGKVTTTHVEHYEATNHGHTAKMTATVLLSEWINLG